MLLLLLAAAWCTEGPFILLEAQTSRLCLSFSLLLSLPGRFLALLGVLGAAVGLLLQQRLISSSPSRDPSCTRTHNPSATQALYTARMRATGLKEGLQITRSLEVEELCLRMLEAGW
jgi:hypothetical protein